MKPLLLLGLLVTCAFSQTPDPTLRDARIYGIVMDADGKPISEATVSIAEESLLSITDAYPVQVKTDSRGHFDSGETLKHGVYDIYVRSEKDGYPDRSSAFYHLADFQPQTVQLFGAQPEANVEIKLGDKAAVLTGNIIDSDSGQPVDASVLLINAQMEGAPGVVNSKLVQAKNGKFRELVPEKTDVVVRVRKPTPASENWSYFSCTVHLEPGETKSLNIRLYKMGTE